MNAPERTPMPLEHATGPQVRSERAQRESHASGPPSRQRRFGASAVASAEAEAGRRAPASERAGGSGGAKPPGLVRSTTWMDKGRDDRVRMNLRRIEAGYPRRNLHGQIVNSIGRKILRGELQPGDAIPAEPDLPASRTAVREAIKVLVAKGLVETRPRTGTRVRGRDAWNLLDPDVMNWGQDGDSSKALLRSVTEVRSIIEPAAAELAAKRATPEDIASLERAYSEMEAAMPASGPGDVAAFVDADTRFHLTIFQAAGNHILEQMSGVVYSALRYSFEATSRIPGSARASLPRHRAVLDAIRARRGPDASEAMRALLRRIERKIKVMTREADTRERRPPARGRR